MTASFIPPGTATGSLPKQSWTAPISRPGVMTSTVKQADVIAAIDMLGIPTANLVEVTIGLRNVRITRNARDEHGMLTTSDGAAEHTVDVRRIVK